MAESAVRSSVNMLEKIIIEEGKYLWGAGEKVRELQEELLWMRSFLRKADVVQQKDEIVWMWVCQVQKYVYEAEDVIDKFVINVVSLRRQNGWRSKLMRYSCIFKELYDLHQAASDIDSLKVKISSLSPKLEKYGLMRTFGVNTDQLEESRTEQLQHIQRNAYVEKKKITGLDQNAKEIIKALTSTSPDKGFHAIYRMGGCGKTTLTTKILHDEEVKQHFPGGQLITYVSKKFKVENVLRDLLQQLDSKRSSDEFDSSERDRKISVQELSRIELDSKFGEVLKTKCLIVLDDVWTKEAWDSLSRTFILCGSDSGSKLLLTTRKKEVATYVDHEALEKPDLLNDEESFQLLKVTMGWDSKESLTHAQDEKEIFLAHIEDASEKKELADKMLKVCKGLPLSIVVLGGILRKKQSVSEWKSVLNNISSQLLTGYDHGRSCMEILLQSYDDLAFHLKPCFLHLAIFPEDRVILSRQVYRMWIGEGLVTKSARGGVGRSKTMVEVARGYLHDLVDAGLVNDVETSNGQIHKIMMHDLVRDMCLEKASADNIVKIFDFLPNRYDQTQGNTSSSDYYSSDRVFLKTAIHFSRTTEYSLVTDSIMSNARHLKCIRSLIFMSDGWTGADEEACELMRCICSEFQVLRVLVLKGLRDKGRLTSNIGKLVHLRYLSLDGTWIQEIPSSICKLRFLEILDLNVEEKLVIPNTLWKLSRLTHLIFPALGYEIKGGGRLRVDTLIYLEYLANLLLSNLRTKDLLKIKNLRKLWINCAVSQESARDILSFFKISFHLEFCGIKEVEGGAISEFPELLSSIVCRCSLWIRGKINLVENINISLPPYLSSVTLHKCELKDDPMEILGSLSHLEYLWLDEGCYTGNKISCNSSSFPLLTRLVIIGLNNLNVWEAENGSMPRLDALLIKECPKVNRLPDVLPLSLRRFALFDIGDGYDPEIVEGEAQIMSPYDFVLGDAVLSNPDKLVFVLLGEAGACDEFKIMLSTFGNRNCITFFDVIAKTWAPRSSTKSSGLLLPRRNLEQLLRDLNNNKDKEEVSRMSCEELTSEIQQVMQRKKCLVFIFNLELAVDGNLDAELEKMFGHRREGYAERGSKLVITSPSTYPSDHMVPADYHRVIVATPNPIQNWQFLMFNDGYGDENAGLKWNWMRHHSGHHLSTSMFARFVARKKNITEWAFENKKLLNDANPMDFSQVFTFCYDDLPLHLRCCLIYLLSFPAEAVISTKKLYEMWIAAGFVGGEQDDAKVIQNAEESLMEIASTYLNELCQRRMIKIVKVGPTGKVKSCQLDFALRDMCSAKDKEDNWLNTQDLTVCLDQNSVPASASLEEQLSSLEYYSSPTSLLLFPDISNPLYNEDNWEWFLYICKHFQLLRILDAEGMQMSKGRLPEQVGDLTHLRYLSLKATWITHLPSSLKNLINLQTLDLRVMETVLIPDVLWKLKCLMHLYLPQDFVPQETPKLQLSGLSLLETLVNLDTDKVLLKDLAELKQLKRLSVRRIHAADADDLADILIHLRKSMELCVNSHIINDDHTILARKFHSLQKLKIKGSISIELKPEIFPPQLEELTLKHTRLEDDPLAVLEKLPKLRLLFLDHESFLGKKMRYSRDLYGRVNLMLCSLYNLETLYIPERKANENIMSANCWRLGTDKNEDEGEGEGEEEVHTCFNLPCLKKGPLRKLKNAWKNRTPGRGPSSTTILRRIRGAANNGATQIKQDTEVESSGGLESRRASVSYEARTPIDEPERRYTSDDDHIEPPNVDSCIKAINRIRANLEPYRAPDVVQFPDVIDALNRSLEEMEPFARQ